MFRSKVRKFVKAIVACPVCAVWARAFIAIPAIARWITFVTVAAVTWYFLWVTIVAFVKVAWGCWDVFIYEMVTSFAFFDLPARV